MQTKKFDKYVFSSRETVRYRFPTHSCELIVDRSEAAASEAFLVVLEQGEAPPVHIHYDTEQVFYILQGRGELQVGADGSSQYPVSSGDLVRIPPGTYHRILCEGPEVLRYLSIDCFPNGCPPDEPTWDAHIRVVCRENSWDFDRVKAR